MRTNQNLSSNDIRKILKANKKMKEKRGWIRSFNYDEEKNLKCDFPKKIKKEKNKGREKRRKKVEKKKEYALGAT